jgi:hypothetical protein
MGVNGKTRVFVDNDFYPRYTDFVHHFEGYSVVQQFHHHHHLNRFQRPVLVWL